MAPVSIDRTRISKPQLGLMAALAACALLLLYLARARAHWPWFSLWLLLLLAGLAVLSREERTKWTILLAKLFRGSASS